MLGLRQPATHEILDRPKVCLRFRFQLSVLLKWLDAGVLACIEVATDLAGQFHGGGMAFLLGKTDCTARQALARLDAADHRIASLALVESSYDFE
jgi:hypothetical protein